MKKILMAVLVLLISVTFVSTVFAQAKPAEKPAAEKAAPAAEKPAAPADKPAGDKPDVKKDEAPAKPKPKFSGFVGTVTALNGAEKLITVKGPKDTVTFDASNAKFKGYKAMDNVHVGDKIAVKYGKKDGIMITKIAAAKVAKKEAAPAKEKKEKPAKKSKKFKDVDGNKDGKITIEELTVVFINITPDQFKAFDKNNDGALDENEFKAVK